MKINKILLLLIIILAGFLRFYRLNSIPPSLQWDEVAMGYDSYSVLKTGKDQFGKSLPLFFRSLDDWKPAFYEYTAVFPIAVFGLNEFSVRFPAALLGGLTILLVFLLVKEIFPKCREVALLSAFLLAISPWHLQISRAAFEVTISIFIFVLANLLFLKSLKNYKLLLFSSFCFGLGFFTYHSARVVFPLMWLNLLILFRKKIVFFKKAIINFCLPFFLLAVVFSPFIFDSEVQMRFKATNIFEIEKNYQQSAEKILAAEEKGWGSIAKIIYNRRLSIITWENFIKVFNNYLVHFRPDFLFLKADVPLHHAPGMGLLYIWELPFIILGIFFLIKDYLKKESLVLLIWFLLAPLPASVTWGVPHAIRSALFIPTFEIFAAFGFYKTYQLLSLRKKTTSLVFCLLMGGLLLLNIKYYLYCYYIALPQQWSDKWLYGRKQAVQFTEDSKQDYEKIIVSTKLEYPWVFWLFYSKYDPNQYLIHGGTVSGGFAEQRNKFDKYEFREFDYLKEKNGTTLFVGFPEEFPKTLQPIKIIDYLDEKPAILINK